MGDLYVVRKTNALAWVCWGKLLHHVLDMVYHKIFDSGQLDWIRRIPSQILGWNQQLNFLSLYRVLINGHSLSFSYRPSPLLCSFRAEQTFVNSSHHKFLHQSTGDFFDVLTAIWVVSVDDHSQGLAYQICLVVNFSCVNHIFWFFWTTEASYLDRPLIVGWN